MRTIIPAGRPPRWTVEHFASATPQVTNLGSRGLPDVSMSHVPITEPDASLPRVTMVALALAEQHIDRRNRPGSHAGSAIAECWDLPAACFLPLRLVSSLRTALPMLRTPKRIPRLSFLTFDQGLCDRDRRALMPSSRNLKPLAMSMVRNLNYLRADNVRIGAAADARAEGSSSPWRGCSLSIAHRSLNLRRAASCPPFCQRCVRAQPSDRIATRWVGPMARDSAHHSRDLPRITHDRANPQPGPSQ
jgi:hypothetical protein